MLLMLMFLIFYDEESNFKFSIILLLTRFFL